MNNYTLDKFSGIGNNIIQEGIFERFPELIPYIGTNYNRTDGKHKRLLFIGESNYFPAYPESVSVFQNADKWYNAQTDNLIPKEKIVDVSNDTGYPPFVRAFNIANKLLTKNGIRPYDDRLGESGFYNYFLRPALNPGSGKYKKIALENIDKEVAGTALCGIIEIIKPEIIIFLSKFAYKEFIKYTKTHNIEFNDIYIDSVVHPSCAWWNRYNGIYGKVALENILSKHWLN